MKKREFKMNGKEYSSVNDLVDKVNSTMTRHAELFGNIYYPMDYVKLAVERFIPMEQYDFDCELQPVTCKGILSFVGKGTLQLYDDEGELIIKTVGYRGNDVTMKKEGDLPLDIADACAVAESLIYKRCFKNLGIGADISIESSLKNCTIRKSTPLLNEIKISFSNNKISDSSNNKISEAQPEITDEKPKTFSGYVKVASKVKEKDGKACFEVYIPEAGQFTACIEKDGKLAKFIGQLKIGLEIGIIANVYESTNCNYLEITKVTNI